MDLLVHLRVVFAIIDVEDGFLSRGPCERVLFREMVTIIQVLLEVLGVELLDPLFLDGLGHVELDEDKSMLLQEIVFILITEVINDTMGFLLRLVQDVLDPD